MSWPAPTNGNRPGVRSLHALRPPAAPGRAVLSRAAVWLALALSAAGCAQPPAAVRVVSASADQIELDAGGRKVVVSPPQGDCLDAHSVHLHPEAAVTRLSSCDGAKDGSSQLITIGAEPLFGGASAAQELAALEAHLRGRQGRDGLGLADDDPAHIVASHRRESALYLVLESASPPFGLMCRAFTEINGRMAMVSTTAGPWDEGDAGALLARAEAMVGALRDANPPPVAPDAPQRARPVGPAPAPRPHRA